MTLIENHLVLIDANRKYWFHFDQMLCSCRIRNSIWIDFSRPSIKIFVERGKRKIHQKRAKISKMYSIRGRFCYYNGAYHNLNVCDRHWNVSWMDVRKPHSRNRFRYLLLIYESTSRKRFHKQWRIDVYPSFETARGGGRKRREKGKKREGEKGDCWIQGVNVIKLIMSM